MTDLGAEPHRLALPYPRNTVLAVGFCAPGTLGAELFAGADVVHIFGEPVPMKAGIAHMEFYSAHGDRTELLRFLNGQDRDQVQRLFLVHGVPRALEGLRTMLAAAGFRSIEVPGKGKQYEL